MKLSDLVNIVESLKVLVEKPMKASIGYKLTLILKKCDAEYSAFSERKNYLIKKFGDDGVITPLSQNWTEFNKEFLELLETEINIQIDKIKLSLISDIEIEAKHLIGLTTIIEEY